MSTKLTSKSASKNLSPKREVCDKCEKTPVIHSYGKILCAKHGLEHLKELGDIKKHGIYF